MRSKNLVSKVGITINTEKGVEHTHGINGVSATKSERKKGKTKSMLDVTLTQGEAIARLHRDETPRFARGLSSLSLTLAQELVATPFVSVALTLFFFFSFFLFFH